MKKTYIAPSLEAFNVEPTAILAGSEVLEYEGSNTSVTNPTAESRILDFPIDWDEE